jgi:hypothetical protein
MANEKKDPLAVEIAGLQKLKVPELRKRYLALFGEESRSQNKQYLFKRIAYRMQEKKYGGLTERARRRTAELAKDAPIRRRPNLKGMEVAKETKRERDPRLPNAGTLLRRVHGKTEHTVKVLERDFEYKGKRHRSLSAIARQITGTSWNGFSFFGLNQQEA